MLYKMTSTSEERIGSSTVIRGATVWRHLPTVNPYHISCVKLVIIQKTCFAFHLRNSFEGGKQNRFFHRRKGTLQAFSRSLDIDELVVLFFAGLMFFYRTVGFMLSRKNFSQGPVNQSTIHRDGNLLGEWSIILSLKLVSMPHSCPRKPDHCDVIAPPVQQNI